MSLAVYEHHTEIAMLLVHRGAEVNIIEEVCSNPQGCTLNTHSFTCNTCTLYRMETVH